MASISSGCRIRGSFKWRRAGVMVRGCHYHHQKKNMEKIYGGMEGLCFCMLLAVDWSCLRGKNWHEDEGKEGERVGLESKSTFRQHTTNRLSINKHQRVLCASSPICWKINMEYGLMHILLYLKTLCPPPTLHFLSRLSYDVLGIWHWKKSWFEHQKNPSKLKKK